MWLTPDGAFYGKNQNILTRKFIRVNIATLSFNDCKDAADYLATAFRSLQ